MDTAYKEEDSSGNPAVVAAHKPEEDAEAYAASVAAGALQQHRGMHALPAAQQQPAFMTPYQHYQHQMQGKPTSNISVGNLQHCHMLFGNQAFGKCCILDHPIVIPKE